MDVRPHMKALIVVLILLAVGLVVPAFITDMKVHYSRHTVAEVSAGAKSQAVTLKDGSAEVSLRPVAQIGIALDVTAIVLILILLRRKSGASHEVRS
jgi:hypothetical protein